MVAAIRVSLLTGARVTGARVNEILHARWNFIDFERGLLNLPDSKTGKKSVYINAPALEILASLLRLEGDPFIFPGRKRGAPLARLDRPWTAIKKAAGLDDLRLHDLRHSHASIGAGAGLSLPIIGKILDDKPICAFGARSCTCSVRDNWCGDCRRSGRSEAGATDSIADAQMSARKDAKTFMAWARLVHGHQWIDREPLDLAAIEAEIVRLLRAEHPVPAFAQKWLVGWYSPRGDLGRGEDGYAARKFRNERRDYERGLKIAEKVTNGEKSVDAAIKEVLIEEKKANGESDAEITDGQLRQGKRSWASAKLFMHPEHINWLDRLADRRRRKRVQPEVTAMTSTQQNDEALWSDGDVARFLGISVSTLRKSRMTGHGIPHIKLGFCVRYVPAIVRQYVAERTRQSTSEPPGPILTGPSLKPPAKPGPGSRPRGRPRKVRADDAAADGDTSST
jgi:hypothetical protein